MLRTLCLLLPLASCTTHSTDAETGETECGEGQYKDVDGSCVDYLSGDDDTGEVEDTGDDAGSCEILETVPADGDGDAYYRSAIEVRLSSPDSSARISLVEVDGAEVAGTTAFSSSQDLVYFIPDHPLQPSTSYEAAVSACDFSTTFAFTTSELGSTPVADVSELVGRTYVVDLTTARFVEPAGLGPVLGAQLRNSILLSVTAAGDQTIALLGATSVEGRDEQDFCQPTIDDLEADFSDQPYFVASGDIDLDFAGYAVSVQDFVLSGTFAPDLSYVGGGVLSGLIDTRPMVGLVDPDAAEDTICQLAAGFGAECTACSDGEELCLFLLADQIFCDGIDGALEPVSQADCHAECEASADNPDCEL